MGVSVILLKYYDFYFSLRVKVVVNRVSLLYFYIAFVSQVLCLNSSIFLWNSLAVGIFFFSEIAFIANSFKSSYIYNIKTYIIR